MLKLVAATKYAQTRETYILKKRVVKMKYEHVAVKKMTPKALVTHFAVERSPSVPSLGK